jgi:hypothetical protein
MVLKSAVGANPTLLYQSLISSRHSLPFFFRLADKFWLGRSLALPICPPTEVGGYEKKKKAR